MALAGGLDLRGSKARSLWDDFRKLPGYDDLYYSRPHTVKGAGVIERRLIPKHNCRRARNPWRERYWNAWLGRKNAQRCRCCGRYHGVGDAHAHPEWSNIHHGLVIHDSCGRLTTCHDSVYRQDTKHTWCGTETTP